MKTYDTELEINGFLVPCRIKYSPAHDGKRTFVILEEVLIKNDYGSYDGFPYIKRIDESLIEQIEEYEGIA